MDPKSTDHSSGKDPSGDHGGTTRQATDDVKKDATDLGHAARQSGERTVDEAADQAKGRAESLKSETGDTVSDTAEALDAAADTLEGEGQERIAEALSHIAHNLGEFASQLEHKSVDELLHDGGRLAQRNPLMFVAGSVGAGVLLSRFFRARSRSPGEGRYATPGREPTREGETPFEEHPSDLGTDPRYPEAGSSPGSASPGGSRPSSLNEPHRVPQGDQSGTNPASPSKPGGER